MVGQSGRLHPVTERLYLGLSIACAYVLVVWNASVWLAPPRSITAWEQALVTFAILGLLVTYGLLFCARFAPRVVPATLLEASQS